MKKEMVAMILAGGAGTRLKALTTKVAKPAVYYGGKYRIIDFPLSNCTNSGIEIVGVLTQYESIQLNNYVGSGTKWGLDGNHSLASVLPPRQKADGAMWYSGTAHAIYQNIDFIDQYEPDYLLILSGDHIYKMDYDKMLESHKKRNADATIAVLDVSLEEASRFGIMNTKDDDVIYEFEEKPAKPKSTLASMGIYIFSYPVLREYLIRDAENKSSSHDFGKDIIPSLLNDGKKMFAYRFNGYWKDVGTIESLWQANMDLLDTENELDLLQLRSKWKIYSEDTYSRPQYISPDAKVVNSIINQGCVINGEVNSSILFSNARVGKGAKVIDSVIMPNAVIEDGAEVYRSIVDSDYVVKKGKSLNKGEKEIALFSNN